MVEPVEKAVFQFVLVFLLGYEIAAIQTRELPTITQILSDLPWWASLMVIAGISGALADHIYWKRFLP